jgi:hypothetical protein
MSQFLQIKCGQCALKSPDGKVCRRTRAPIRSLDSSCPEGTTYLEKCDICGGEFIPSDLLIDMTNGIHLICHDCNAVVGTCYVCKKNIECFFETDPDPLPKQVQKQMTTPQGYIVTTIRNPDRIEKLCKKCECFSAENECSRQINWCEKYQVIWETEE